MAGRLLFYAIEAVRGRPLSERTQEIGLRVGIALLAMLSYFQRPTTYCDWSRAGAVNDWSTKNRVVAATVGGK
jgi:hypothetical protein